MSSLPTGMVAVRDIVVGGTTIPAGTALTSEQIKVVSQIQSLLANGAVKVTPDVPGRPGGRRQPTYLNPAMVKHLIASAKAAEDSAAKAAAKAKADAEAKAKADAAKKAAASVES